MSWFWCGQLPQYRPGGQPAQRLRLPHASIARCPTAAKTHLAIKRRKISPIPTGRTPGCLSRTTSTPRELRSDLLNVSRRDIEKHGIRSGHKWINGTGVSAREVRVSHGRVFFTEHLKNASACLGANIVRLENSLAITVCQTAYGFAEATREHRGVELLCCRFIVVGAASRACPAQ